MENANSLELHGILWHRVGRHPSSASSGGGICEWELASPVIGGRLRSSSRESAEDCPRETGLRSWRIGSSAAPIGGPTLDMIEADVGIQSAAQRKGDRRSWFPASRLKSGRWGGRSRRPKAKPQLRS